MMGKRLVLGTSCLAIVCVACKRTESPANAVSQSERRPSVPSAGVPDHLAMRVLRDSSPLTEPIRELQPSRVRSLLESGADPNVREGPDPLWWPPLALAMRGTGGSVVGAGEARAQREIVDLLLAHGADANIRWCGDHDRPSCNDLSGITPLMYAAILGDEDVARVLVQHGADPSLRDWRGLTASDYWGLRSGATPLCLVPRRHEPLVDDARLLMNEEHVWEHNNVEIRKALKESPDRSVGVVRNERVCERAARAYARSRMSEPIETTPRVVLPVLVIRVGPVWLVDDRRGGGISETGVYTQSWRLIGWYMTGS